MEEDRWVSVVREVWRGPNSAAALGLVARTIFEIGGEQPVQALRVLVARAIGLMYSTDRNDEA
jgi:hypothetical protein